MSIQSINYSKRGFQVSLAWPKGVQETILYALPKDAAQLAEDDLLELRSNHAALQSLCGFSYKAGGVGPFNYSPNSPALNAKWIDIRYCDFSASGEVVKSGTIGSYFNGSCTVGHKIAYSRVSDRFQAVTITVQNQSDFDIEAGGIGYRVGARVFSIPMKLKRRSLIELPQFEIPVEASVELHRFDEKYPAEFVSLKN